MRRIVIAILLLLTSCTSASRPGREGFISAPDNIQLYYRTVGAGNPIVVIHGGPGMDHGSVANDLEVLSETHRLIFYDQRGGGRSTLPSDTKLLTIDHHVADLEAVRRHFAIERLTILAHSFGPAIAALYAIEHPDRVQKMIFIGPIPPRKSTFFEDYGAAMTKRLSVENMQRMNELEKSFPTATDLVAVCREYWALGIPPRLAKGVDASIVRSDLCTAPADAFRFGMTKTSPITFGSLGDWDWRQGLSVVNAPVLIIHGEEEAIPMILVQEWTTALPNASLLRVASAAHFPHAERPEIVFPAITAFLRHH